MSKKLIFVSISLVGILILPTLSLGQTQNTTFSQIDCNQYTSQQEKLMCTYFNLLLQLYTLLIQQLQSRIGIQPGQPVEPIASSEFLTYITPPDLAKESELVFKFKYPRGFIVDEGGYKTPGGHRFPSISIKKIGGLDIDIIWIPGGMSTGPEITCKTQLYVGDKCTEISGYVITTKSKDPSVLKAYEIITSTFEVHYYKNYYNVNTSSITVLSPNGGEKWQLGDTHTILWTPYEPSIDSIYDISGKTPGINPVTQVTAYLEKLVNGNFVSVGKIVECGKASIHWDGSLDTCGSNNYPEPGDYYVRVVNNVTGASDRSDGPFTLVPKGTIKVDLKINGSDGPIIVPKGGATYTISWTSNAEKCDIYGLRGVYQLGAPSSGSISMNLLATDEYPYPDRVSIHCYSKKPVEGRAHDYVELLPSDISLTVLSPNGGETIDFNSYYKITWKAPPNLTKVSIALYRNDAFYTWIVRDLPTMNALRRSYDWLPSNTVISDNDFGKNIFKIYILGYKSDGGTVEDKSDAPFNITEFILLKSLTPSITILSPNGGERWGVGSTQTISWRSENLPSNSWVGAVDLYKGNTFITGLVPFDSKLPTTGSIQWTIPQNHVTGDDFRIEVRVFSGPTWTGGIADVVSDFSDAPFSIVK